MAEPHGREQSPTSRERAGFARARSREAGTKAGLTRRVRPASAPRMRSVVDTAQPPSVDVAVQLRRRERAVAEQLLDRAQVGPAFEQVRRESVPQAMRVREDPPEG